MSFQEIPQFANNDVIDRERLNIIISNLSTLNQSKVTMRYAAYGEDRTDGIKVCCGVTDMNSPNNVSRNRWVSTGSFFTPGSRPVAVVTHGSLRNRWSTTSVAQRTGASPQLDHTGFQCYMRSVTPGVNLSGPNYLNWIMMGY